MNILQVNTTDQGGGAEKVAVDLWGAYRGLGYGSWLAVGRRNLDESSVFKIPEEATSSVVARLAIGVRPLFGSSVEGSGSGFLGRRLDDLARFPAPFDKWLGVEDFNFPGSWRVLDLPPAAPDIVHLHNLHGRYFDLRFLPELSRRIPVAMTLHDVWTMTGHCAYTLGCERWESGCGACPDLSIFPAVRRDRTHQNWRRKRDIYKASRIYVATPSRWLMNKVERSMLAPAVALPRVIHNGVDLSLFRPGDKRDARRRHDVPEDASVLVFASRRVKEHRFKDYPTLRDAISRAAARMSNQRLIFLAIGEDAPDERVGRAEIRFIPYLGDPSAVASVYQAADLYLHAARIEAENFPLAVLEALACGLPVVATAVGGIPEQVEDLSLDPDRATGALAPPGDADSLATAIVALLENEELRCRLAGNARRDAERRFGLEQQTQAYLEWYGAMAEDWTIWRKGTAP